MPHWRCRCKFGVVGKNFSRLCPRPHTVLFLAMMNVTSFKALLQRERIILTGKAWESTRNGMDARGNWQFTAGDAQIKVKRLYPALDRRQDSGLKFARIVHVVGCVLSHLRHIYQADSDIVFACQNADLCRGLLPSPVSKCRHGIAASLILAQIVVTIRHES